MMSEIENFYGCYLLVSGNVKYKGWTYIGFTVDPNRRINQHNDGKDKGGAWRTSGKGPWDMVLIIHGFPNKVSALQFEWAWQNPQKSRKLKEICFRHKNLKGFKYRFAVVSEMLRAGPWNRLPLTIRWLNQDFVTEFAIDLQPPTHMPIAYGPVKISKIKKLTGDTSHALRDSRGNGSVCSVCLKALKPQSNESSLNESLSNDSPSIDSESNKPQENDPHGNDSQENNLQADDSLRCLNADCPMMSHMICLAKDFLSQEKAADMLMPLAGDCVLCSTNLLWGDLLRQKNGCYQALGSKPADEGDNEEINHMDIDDHWSATLTQH